MTRSDAGDGALVRKFRDGDESALRALFDRVEPRLRSRIDARLSPDLRRKLSVDDLLQEVYLTAYRRLDDFEDRGEGAFEAWVSRIAALKLREEIRRWRGTARRGAAKEVTRGARPDTDFFPVKDASPSQVAAGRELRDRVRLALRELPENYREILRLVQIEHLALRDAGERMGISREAAKKLYGRALSRLSDLLGEEGKA